MPSSNLVLPSPRSSEWLARLLYIRSMRSTVCATSPPSSSRVEFEVAARRKPPAPRSGDIVLNLSRLVAAKGSGI